MELKQCPFCGCDDVSMNEDGDTEYIWCPLCLCRIEFVEGDIADKYNTRHLSGQSSKWEPAGGYRGDR